jgi:hypothetical protein
VPQFTTTLNSSTVTVALPNHGLLAGQSFTVEVQTSVGGLTLLGPYAAATIIDANSFTITAPYPAGSPAVVSENNGQVNLATQATIQGLTLTAYPVDIILYPMSRGDFQAIPPKAQQGRPTSVWIDRQISPVINIWPLPDANGPYELRFKASRQVQDADIVSGQALNVPFRFYEAFCADLAAHLAMKWAPERLSDLAKYASDQWTLASDEDVEKVSTFISGNLSSYFD